MENKPIKFVLTGGPCTGKTTTINHLGKMGYQTIQEAASLLIEEEIKNDIPLWKKDVIAFQKKLILKQIEFESQINPEKITFIDRSIIDTIAYCKIFKTEPTKEFVYLAKTHTYANIFVLDFLNFYETNEIRLENKKIAKKIHQTLINTYTEFGYNPIFIPALELSDRINFILSKISTQSINHFEETRPQTRLHI